MSFRALRAPLVVALLLLAPGCIQGFGGLTTTSAPEVRMPPTPKKFQGETAPALEATDRAGLKSAPTLGPNVYYDEREDLWYRRAFRRWYQAFRWNGNWFVLDDVPELLVDVTVVKQEPPKLPVPPPRQPWPGNEGDDEPEVIEPP